MKANWIVAEAKKADQTADQVVFENQAVKDSLDDLLLKQFWPVIWICLDGSGYDYEPQKNPEMVSEPFFGSLTRSLNFALFDNGKIFFRGKLSCSKKGWMIESEYFLSLVKKTKFEVLQELLGNTRFCGNPPTLIVDKHREDDFYQIHFQAGNGAGWGRMGKDSIDARLKHLIQTNSEMYEHSKDGQITIEELGSFLTVAYQVYEAY